MFTFRCLLRRQHRFSASCRLQSTRVRLNVMVRRLNQVVSWRRSCVIRAQFGTRPLRFGQEQRTESAAMERLTYKEALADSKEAFLAAVSAVQPAHLVENSVQIKADVLTVKGREFILKKPCHVVGFGKAVYQMALTLEKILGNSMKLGIVSVPVGTTQSHPIPSNSRIEVVEGAKNNLPDEAAERSAKRILDIVKNLGKEDTLLVLISGGGSALLPLPLPPLTLEEKLKVIKLLANAGADILQLNCVRKQLSGVKGGRLALAALPATVISLILSDVIGDPVDSIASGPTSPNTDPPTGAQDVVCQFNLWDRIPKSAQLCLTSQDTRTVFLKGCHVNNIIIGNNVVAINAAAKKMKTLKYSVCILSHKIEGNVVGVASFYSLLASQICELIVTANSSSLEDSQSLSPETKTEIAKAVKASPGQRGISLIAGGETTVQVTGKGVGGRNQELALRFADSLKTIGTRCVYMNQFTVSLMSAGTDGIDGPTCAAGAFGYAEQLKGDEMHLKFLKDNDSHTFYANLDKGENLIVTGHTGTNVMDIHILCIQRK